ncbi:MAG: hypothetical protein ABIV48_10905 [Pyrinomonadaceae bacterium]
MRSIKKIGLVLIGVALLAWATNAQNLKPDEIIAKHLNVLGSPEKRGAVKTLMALGASEFESKVPNVKGGGKAIIVSDPNNFLFIISLNSKEYPFEKIGYFDGSMSLPFITAGTRSLLGSYIANNEKILSEGLFGGIMSLRWPFGSADSRKPKINSGGTKKINGRKAYALEYSPSSGGSAEFSIKLYFDAETFQHIRSDYITDRSPTEAVFGQQNQRANSKLMLVEEFSDFKDVDGLMLPHRYRADFTANSNSGMYQNSWEITVTQYYINQKLEPDFFTFDQK